MAQASWPPPAAARAQASSWAYPASVAGICSCAPARPPRSQIAAVWVSRWVSTPMIQSASAASAIVVLLVGAILEQRHRPGWELPRQSCDGSQPPGAGQAPDQANEGGQAGAGSTGDKSQKRHATAGRSG